MDVEEIASFVRGAFNAAALDGKDEGITDKTFNQYLKDGDDTTSRRNIFLGQTLDA